MEIFLIIITIISLCVAGYCANNKRKVDIAADEENKRIYNQKNNLLSDLTDIRYNIKYA